MTVFEELDKINEEQGLVTKKKSYPGQGPLRRALIAILKMIGVEIKKEIEDVLVLHHVNWNHYDNSLNNLMLVTRSEHSSYHNNYTKDDPFKEAMETDYAFNVGELLEEYINKNKNEITQSEQEANTNQEDTNSQVDFNLFL